MADLPSSELKLSKSAQSGIFFGGKGDYGSNEIAPGIITISPSSSVQSNPVLILRTATQTGLLFGTEERNAVIIELLKTLISLSSSVSPHPVYNISRAMLTANSIMVGSEHTWLSTILLKAVRTNSLLSGSQRQTRKLFSLETTVPFIDDTDRRGLPINAIPKSIALLEISRLQKDIPSIMPGTIWGANVLGLSRTQITSVSIILPAASMNLVLLEMSGSGSLDHDYISGSEIIDNKLNILKASISSNLPKSTEQKFDEFIEIGTCVKADESITLTVMTSRGFKKLDLLNLSPPESSCITGYPKPVKEFKLGSTGTPTRGFIPADLGNVIGFELVSSNVLSSDFVKGDSRLGVNQSLLRYPGVTAHFFTSDKSGLPINLSRATITDKLEYRNAGNILVDLLLLKKSVPESSIVSPLELPFPLLRSVQSGSLFGSGKQYGLRELLHITVILLGSGRFDLRVELTPCRSFDETVKIFPRTLCDEIIILTATPTVIAFDRQLYLWKTADQPALTWLTVESPDICFTKGDIAIEHPAIMKIEFYDTSDALLDTIINLTDLTAKKIVTRKSKTFDIKKTLAYVKVTTADGRVHTVKI
ncbi:MAG: hypothetical protein WCE94_02825 [Candidatus Methanoperedens sp.]